MIVYNKFLCGKKKNPTKISTIQRVNLNLKSTLSKWGDQKSNKKKRVQNSNQQFIKKVGRGCGSNSVVSVHTCPV